MLQRGWFHDLSSLAASVEQRMVIAAPFISEKGAEIIIEALTPAFRESGQIDLLTDLSPSHVSDGSLELGAIIDLCQSANSATLWHIPRLHAKVYIADDARAIVTSGNLTASALYRNMEYGVLVEDRTAVESIHSHFDDFRAAGAVIAFDSLREYARLAAEVREAAQRAFAATDKRLSQALEHMLAEAEDQLIRLRLAGGKVSTVFAATIQYLLMKYGPMKTTRIHELIQSLHPDLCDDSVDRIIDGQSYGKKWKHTVRNAQQKLKDEGVIELDDSIWRLKGAEKD